MGTPSGSGIIILTEESTSDSFVGSRLGEKNTLIIERVAMGIPKNATNIAEKSINTPNIGFIF
jgi:hypothetical protein